LARENHNPVLAGIDHSLNPNRPVLELLGPEARELDETLATMPDRPAVQGGRDNPLEVFSECFRIESAARIPALHCCLELFEKPPLPARRSPATSHAQYLAKGCWFLR
jgi:hypothetical protein